MLGRRWVQGGGVAGVLGVLVAIVAAVIVNNTLSSNSSPAQIASYLEGNRSAILTQQVLSVAGAGLLLWFVGTLARLLQTRDERSPLGLIVLAAGAGMAVMLSLDGLPLTALEFLVKQGGLTDPSVTRIFYDLENGIIMPGGFGFMAAVFLVSLGSAMIRRAFAAAWLGWLSFVLAAFAAAGSVVGLTATSGGTSVFGFLPAIGSLVVILITSIYMLRYRSVVIE
jgi:hypothetical protein